MVHGETSRCSMGNVSEPAAVPSPLAIKLEIDSCGTKRWYYRGWLHRVDGPAVEYTNGAKEWWRYGELHRDGGLPTVVGADGTRMWMYGLGDFHREVGPAIEAPDGSRWWYHHGVEMTAIKEEYTRKMWPSTALVAVCASRRRRALWLPTELWDRIAAIAVSHA